MDNNTRSKPKPKPKPVKTKQVARKKPANKATDPGTKPKPKAERKESDPSHAAVYFCYVLQTWRVPKEKKKSRRKPQPQALPPKKEQKPKVPPNKTEPKLFTYVGYTVNPGQRLRQHRGELKKGAKTTRGWKDAKFATIVWSFDRAFMEGTAKSLESAIKKGSGLEGRLKKIDKLLAEDPRFAGINFYQCTGHDDCMLQLRLMELDK